MPPAQPTLRTADALAAAGLIAPAARDAVAAVERRYAVAITPAMRALIEHPDDPIGRQFLPDPAELITAPHESPDPIADEALSPIKGVVHRYADRALLKPLLVCPVYCRFCFRREHVGPDGGLLSEAELQAAYDWFARPPGDPRGDPDRRRPADAVAAPPARDRRRRCRRSRTSRLLRVHTRVPVADPALVTDALADAMATEKPLWLVVHANHAREFTDAARAALRRVLARGIPLLGQSVLLRGVNDSEAALEALFRAMLARTGEALLPAPARPCPRARRGFTCRSRRGGGCWPGCAGG